MLNGLKFSMIASVFTGLYVCIKNFIILKVNKKKLRKIEYLLYSSLNFY